MKKRQLTAAALLVVAATAAGACGEATYHPYAPAAVAAGTPTFEADILPIFNDATYGCTSASCHFQSPQHDATGNLVLASDGASALELYGFLRSGGAQQALGFAMDVDTANVAESLVLKRPTGDAGHIVRFASPNDPRFVTLETWIADGAPFDAP